MAGHGDSGNCAREPEPNRDKPVHRIKRSPCISLFSSSTIPRLPSKPPFRSSPLSSSTRSQPLQDAHAVELTSATISLGSNQVRVDVPRYRVFRSPHASRSTPIAHLDHEIVESGRNAFALGVFLGSQHASTLSPSLSTIAIPSGLHNRHI
ncbi:hypothetical protein NMY22_g10137 [Coprinellus aureogranulatus]|nr:hypothetical protein NMY22_g10137 [Coprinellus aureogranulatus]